MNLKDKIWKIKQVFTIYSNEKPIIERSYEKQYLYVIKHNNDVLWDTLDGNKKEVIDKNQRHGGKKTQPLISQHSTL